MNQLSISEEAFAQAEAPCYVRHTPDVEKVCPCCQETFSGELMLLTKYESPVAFENTAYVCLDCCNQSWKRKARNYGVLVPKKPVTTIQSLMEELVILQTAKLSPYEFFNQYDYIIKQYKKLKGTT